MGLALYNIIWCSELMIVSVELFSRKMKVQAAGFFGKLPVLCASVLWRQYLILNVNLDISTKLTF